MKNKVGHPIMYRPEYCERLIDHMKGGLSLEAFGGVVGVSEDTLHAWKNRYGEFKEAYEIGKSFSRLHWEELGHDMVLAGQGNSTTWIFNMKNRFGWKDKQDITSDGEKIELSFHNSLKQDE